jgi:lanthanide-dependent methanol dehydrogenase
VPAAASPPEDGQWTMPSRDYANTRYSGLHEIDTDNVSKLTIAFTFATGTLLGQESAPIVVGDTLYFVTPYPNILYAVDLSQPGGALKWKYDPKPAAASQGVACCQPVNRGPTYSNGRIFYNTLDAHTVALDATTGQLQWKTQVGDFNYGDTFTMAPLVVKGKVLVGNSGAEFGARGWLTALNESDGSIAWRAYTTGPDSDVLIDTEFKPFYPQYVGKDLGVTQWPPDQWKIGGGTVWGWISYDPDLDLIYYGTSNPSPWNHEVRPGDNHWTNGIFARDPDTGRARWFYQFSPHDLWDHSAVNENLVLDVNWKGEPRKVIVRPERNGYMYVIDRTNGEVLAADAYTYITASKGVDLKTGRLIYNEEKMPSQGKVVREVCPNSPGAKDWTPSSFSKNTGLIYMPHNNMCMDWEIKPVSYIAGTGYIGVNARFYAGPGDGTIGELMAWDPLARKKVWGVSERWPVWSGTAVTAGGLVFYGNLEGWFKAVHAQTGEVLWQFKTASGIIGQPTTFRGPDGRQYVAILSGIGGWAGAMVSSELDERDPTAAKGFGTMVAELKKQSGIGGMLYVFALPR